MACAEQRDTIQLSVQLKSSNMKEWSCLESVVKSCTCDHNAPTVTVRLCNQVCCSVLVMVVIQANCLQGNAVGAEEHGQGVQGGRESVVIHLGLRQDRGVVELVGHSQVFRIQGQQHICICPCHLRAVLTSQHLRI